MKLSRLVLAGTAALGITAALSGCAPTVHLEPAAAANDPMCAEVIVRLPASLGEQARVWTDAQATAAWGTPSVVLLTCGLKEPAQTTQQCVSLGGADWLVDESDSPNLRLTTYGRAPAVQVFVDTTTISADSVLESLAGAVQQIPATTACTTPATDDTNAGEGTP
ncbi:DUF3515 family protein [uncultured Microbacterium sp.]|uniref:DUF3515 family protein n=1 Tax=uncultured Microbacterium sp. TaxID=191216 RepID=UPI0028DAFDD0|nr:DUF3515 family protein [uncultured Microbacterium sp.]